METLIAYFILISSLVLTLSQIFFSYNYFNKFVVEYLDNVQTTWDPNIDRRLLAFSLLLAGVSFGTVYTKDSVITQEETSLNNMKRMMSLYTLTKSLGNSIGSTVMGYIYALSFTFISLQIHNVILLSLVILIILMVLWAVIYREQK